MFLASSVLALWGLLLALRRRARDATLFGLLLLFYPAIYYVVYPHPRYRHPIEPEMLILGVYLVSQAETRKAGAALRSKSTLVRASGPITTTFGRDAGL